MKLCRLSEGLSGEAWTRPLSGRWTGGKTAVGRGRGPAREPLSTPAGCRAFVTSRLTRVVCC